MKRALIIDDDADYRALLAELIRTAGWEAREATDGEQGIELAKSDPPDVVFCDLLMAGCNGFQVCRALRAESALRDLHIVVSSGRVFDADKQGALDAGANEYLTKPMSAAQLMAVLERLSQDDQPPRAASPVVPPKGGQTPDTLVRFWGVRGSIPSPGPDTVGFGGNTSCVELRADGEIIILDAGSGLRTLGNELVREFGDQPLSLTLLLSHTHWDHIQGLPFFAPIYTPNCQLRILGYEGARSSLSNVLSGQMESPYFPVGFNELPGNLKIEELRDMEFNIGNVKVKVWFANHPGICVGYRLNTSSSSVAFFPDNEPPTRQHRSQRARKKSDRMGTDFVKAEEHKLVSFIESADIMIMDSQYDTDEYEQHVGWGHGCVDDVVRLAVAAKVKHLFLFHHDPDHDDAKIAGMEARAQQMAAEQGSSLKVEAAREGRELRVGAVAWPKPA